MVEQMDDDNLTDVLKAVSDPTRRSLLTTLVQQGPTRVTELAAHYEMSLNAISKHIKVLEQAGLVIRKTMGRVHLIEARLEPAHAIDAWFTKLRTIWALRLDALEELVKKGDNKDD